MSVIQKYWRRHAKPRKGYGFVTVPEIVCKDGFKMSVQASASHYCAPRELVASGAYAAWEVGFPSKKEKALMPFCEDADKPTETVYGYVPTQIIDDLIAKHGGLEQTV